MTVPQPPPHVRRYFCALAVQIMSQLVDGELMIPNNIFDQIADRDDSDQLSIVNDGKIANSSFSVITAMHSSAVRIGWDE